MWAGTLDFWNGRNFRFSVPAAECKHEAAYPTVFIELRDGDSGKRLGYVRLSTQVPPRVGLLWRRSALALPARTAGGGNNFRLLEFGVCLFV